MNDAKVRIFVSSPADVEHERAMVKDLLERLAREFLPYFRVEPILWEEEALTADRTFQAGMVQPSECEIVLVVLWTRLGSPLPQNPYQGRTGTEWEFFDAVEASSGGGRPEVLVYKKTNPKLVDITNPQQTLQAVEDRKRLEEFFRINFFNEDQTFRRAFRTFDSDAVFRDLVEVQLRKLLNRRIFVERRGPGRAFEWSGSPFRARVPFGFGDERVFTGRENETRELVSRLHEQTRSGVAFHLISGASGSGKSSLVRAGLLPRLVRPHQVPGVAGCRWCLVEPSGEGDPVADLARALCSGDALGDKLGDVGVDADMLRRGLEADPELAMSQIRSALDGLTRAYRDDTGERGASVRLAVVVDSLDGLVGAKGRHDGFFAALGALARSGSAWVVALARSDRLPDLSRSDQVRSLVRDRNWSRLEPMPAARSRQVIDIPVLVAGLSYGAESGPKLPELLEAQSASLPLWAPLVQGTLERLFQKQLTADLRGQVHSTTEQPLPGGEAKDEAVLHPDAEGLDALGGLAGDALRRAEEVWAGCREEDCSALPRLCRALIGLEGLSQRRPTPRAADLGLLESDPACARLVRALIDARVLVSDAERDPVLLTPCEDADYSFRAWFGRAVRDTRAGWNARLGGDIRGSDDPSSRSSALEPDSAEPDLVSEWRGYRRTVALTHPRLMRVWRPMADWLERRENREDLVLRGQIDRQARLWKRTDCNREYLLGETGFAAASRFTAQYAGELEPAENELIAQSERYLRAQRRGKRLVRATGLVLVSLLALVTLAAYWAWEASGTATVNLHRSRLNAADLAVTRGNTPRAVVLALDAAPLLPGRAANVLSRALTGSHLVAMAHEGPPLAGLPLDAALDASGELLLSVDPSVGLRLWRLDGSAFRPEPEARGAELGMHTVLFAGDRTAGGFFGISPGGVWRVPLDNASGPDYPCGAESGAIHALDRDGRRLALSYARSSDRDGVCMLDLQSPGEPIFDITPHEGEIRSVAFSPDGSRLLTSGRDGRVKVLDAADGRVLLTLPLEGPLRPVINRAVFDPQGERIVLATSDRRLRVYGLDGRELGQLGEVEEEGEPRLVHGSEVRDIAFSPDGSSLVAVDDDGQVVRWDLARDSSAFVLGHHEDSAELVRISAAGSRVLTASRDNTARLWDLGTGRQLAVFSHDGAVSKASFSADGRRVLTLSGEDGSARLWDARPVPRLGLVIPHDGHVRHLAFAASPLTGSRRLATASSSGLVRVWDLAEEGYGFSLGEPMVLSGHERAVRRLDFSSDGSRLASAGQDGTARIWDLSPGAVPDRTLCRLKVSGTGGDRVSHVLFDPSPQPGWLLTASDGVEEPLKLWEPESCTPIPVGELARLSGAGIQAAAVQRSEGGVLVAVGSDDGRVQVLFLSDEGRWSRRCDLPQHSRPVLDLDISPDGRLVASASEDRWARILSVASCAGDASSVDLVGHSDTVRSVRFSANGERLVTASLDGSARIWEASGGLVAELTGHRNRVYHAEFGVNDRFVLTSSRDGAVRVWQNPGPDSSLRPAAELVFNADFGGVPYAAFSPDGRSIAAGYWHNAAAVWRLLDPVGQDGGGASQRASWGEPLYDLALIGEAWRFRRENQLDALRGSPDGQN